MACFFEDVGHSTRSPDVTVDLLEITKQLGRPEFKVNRDTDYHQLGAKISILDVIVDNGLSAEYDMRDEAAENEFNEEIDRLIAHVQKMASSINDAGASFMSRLDAKEVIEGFRYRLAYAVRTKSAPKASIFNALKKDDSEGIRKQSKLMEKHFKLVKAEG